MPTLILNENHVTDAMFDTANGHDYNNHTNAAYVGQAYLGDFSGSASWAGRALFKWTIPAWLSGAKVTAVRLKTWDNNSGAGGGGPATIRTYPVAPGQRTYPVMPTNRTYPR